MGNFCSGEISVSDNNCSLIHAGKLSLPLPTHVATVSLMGELGDSISDFRICHYQNFLMLHMCV